MQMIETEENELEIVPSSCLSVCQFTTIMTLTLTQSNQDNQNPARGSRNVRRSPG